MLVSQSILIQKKTRINRLLREQRSRGQYSVENDGINNDNASVDEFILIQLLHCQL